MELNNDPGISTEAAAEVIEQKIYGDTGAPPEPVAKATERPSTPTIEDRISHTMAPEAPEPAFPVYQPAKAVTAQGIEIPPEIMPDVVALQNEFQSVDWARLKQMDPGRYAALMMDAQERATEIHRKLAAHSEYTKQQKAMQAQQAQQLREAQLNEARKELYRLIPEWRDTNTREREGAELVEALQAWGYSDSEITQASDPRIFAMLRHYMKEAAKPKQPRAPRVDPVEQEMKRHNWGKHSTEAAALRIERLINA